MFNLKAVCSVLFAELFLAVLTGCGGSGSSPDETVRLQNDGDTPEFLSGVTFVRTFPIEEFLTVSPPSYTEFYNAYVRVIEENERIIGDCKPFCVNAHDGYR